MINKNNKTNFSYAKRIAALPILALLTILLAFRYSDNKVTGILPLSEKYTIIIDAGHGGKDAGTMLNKTSEKEIALAISKAIRELNNDPSLEIILSRNEDVEVALSSRVDLSKQKNADLFISVHVNNVNDASKKGVELYIPNKGHKNYTESLGLANMLNAQLEPIMGGSMGIKTRNSKVYILDNAVCPAALIECGNISNEENRKTLENRSKEIAGSILTGIRQYLSQQVRIIEELKEVRIDKDTVPNKKKDNIIISEVQIENRKTSTIKTKDSKVVKELIDKDKDVKTITISSDESGEKTYTIEKNNSQGQLPDKVQYYLNGKKITQKEMKSLDPNTIKAIHVLKDENAVKKYGEDAKEGVIEIETKE